LGRNTSETVRDIETWIQRTTNRKWDIASPMVTWTMTSRDPERSRSWPQYVLYPLSRKRLEIETWWQWSTYSNWLPRGRWRNPNISKTAGDIGFVRNDRQLVGNGLCRVEWSRVRWRHVSSLLIRNWLHIVTPLSESIKLLNNIENSKYNRKTSVYHTVVHCFTDRKQQKW